jgi:hypothetical protein
VGGNGNTRRRVRFAAIAYEFHWASSVRHWRNRRNNAKYGQPWRNPSWVLARAMDDHLGAVSTRWLTGARRSDADCSD